MIFGKFCLFDEWIFDVYLFKESFNFSLRGLTAYCYSILCVCVFFFSAGKLVGEITQLSFISQTWSFYCFLPLPNESKHEIRFAETVFLKVCFSHDWFRFVRRKNNRKFKVASHLFDKCTRALDSIYNSEEMTPPKQGNNRGENPQKLSIVSRSQNQ